MLYQEKALLEETKGFADRQIAHDGLFRKPVHISVWI
jgi:hypothetical protein